MVQNKSLILAQHPTGYPIPGSDLIISTSEFDLDAPAPEGGVTLKTNYISYDPYLRGRMRPSGSAYIHAFPLNEPISNSAISTVLKSSTPRFKAGDIVLGNTSFSEYVSVPSTAASKEESAGGLSTLQNPLSLDPKIFLGALGMPGLTAYSSFYALAKPKRGETIFISAASGAVGQIVGQLAKREGVRVIGSVGSSEKLRFIKEELGFDAGFEYKSEGAEVGLRRCLKELGMGETGGLDVYYDNVGGEQLDAALGAMNNFGRVVSCGSVSQTSLPSSQTHGIKNMPLVVGKRLSIRGFIVTDPDFGPRYSDEHQRNMQKWIKDGEITVKMSVTEGMENAAEGFVGMLKGKNFGKAVLKVEE